MRCPHCGEFESTVIDSSVSDSGVRRQRACSRCHQEFATLEQVLRTTVTVVKRDGRREDFQREKLLHGLRVAARKRPLPAGTLDAVVEDIEGRLAASGRNEVLSRVIGEMAITHLKRLDPIAYIRFSSAYRQFVSLDDMMDELAQMAAVPLPPAEQPRLFSDEFDRIVRGEREERAEEAGEALPRVPTPIESGRAGAALSV
jgi:transcriptional repressor NrdR